MSSTEVALWLEVAEINGSDAAVWAKDAVLAAFCPQFAEQYAYTFARKAAHAAFLACPSLRG